VPGVPEVVVVLWIGKDRGGIFMRGRRGMSREEFYALIDPHLEDLARLIDLPDRQGDGSRFSHEMAASVHDRTTWSDLIAWQEDRLTRYLRALQSVMRNTV
jgi:hypothetical protein